MYSHIHQHLHTCSKFPGLAAIPLPGHTETLHTPTLVGIGSTTLLAAVALLRYGEPKFAARVDLDSYVNLGRVLLNEVFTIVSIETNKNLKRYVSG